MTYGRMVVVSNCPGHNQRNHQQGELLQFTCTEAFCTRQSHGRTPASLFLFRQCQAWLTLRPAISIQMGMNRQHPATSLSLHFYPILRTILYLPSEFLSRCNPLVKPAACHFTSKQSMWLLQQFLKAQKAENV